MTSNIGRTIYGHCNGYFGRDSYNDKRIEAEGHDWVVARAIGETEGAAEFATFNSPEEKERLIDNWAMGWDATTRP